MGLCGLYMDCMGFYVAVWVIVDIMYPGEEGIRLGLEWRFIDLGPFTRLAVWGYPEEEGDTLGLERWFID